MASLEFNAKKTSETGVLNQERGGGMTKSEKIHELVQKMKSGNLSKNALFAELSRLQRSSKKNDCNDVETKDGANFSESLSSISDEEDVLGNRNYQDDLESDEVLEEEVEEEEDKFFEKGSSVSSTPERRAMIQKLFQEKRKQKQLLNLNMKGLKDENPKESSNENSIFEEKSSYPGEGDCEQTDTNTSLTTSEYTASFDQVNTGNDNDNSGMGSPLDELELEASWNSMYHNRLHREARMRKTLEKNRNKELTFSPRISQLPAEYTREGTHQESKKSFHERMNKWAEKKKQERIHRAREQRKNELEGCTFSPVINRDKTLKEKSNSTTTVDAHERLYAHSKDTRKAQQLAQMRAEKEKQELKDCTFKPTLNTSNSTYVRSRYRNPSPRRRSAPESLPSGMEECSFTPKINQIPENMNAAKVYVSNNIFDRLTKTRNDSYDQKQDVNNTESKSRPIMDMSTFMSSLENSQREMNKLASEESKVRTEPRRASTPRVDKRERRKEFERFLARQNQRELRKQQKIQQVAKQTEQSFKPHLCKKSLQIAKETKHGDFLQRVAKDALRKEHHFLRKKAQAKDPECTFQPKITKSAKNRPARSAIEMSRGDSLKKETNARLMKLKAEQEELSGLTFQPKLNRYGPEVEGRLRVTSDPDNYLQRVQQTQHRLTAKQRRAHQQQEMQELSECTFRPRIHEAPTYVKRIVRSLALARPKEDQDEKARPDWR